MFDAIVRRGTLATVVLLIVLVLGVVAALRIPVQMIPDLEVRTITIRTDWPGATPQDIEKEILIEQEEYLRNVPNLHRLVATAYSGQAWIELEFPYDVDITETLIRVNNALNQAARLRHFVFQQLFHVFSGFAATGQSAGRRHGNDERFCR
jgi:multidrug efflux pump subunit AcrB